jgi:hypothetical protein
MAALVVVLVVQLEVVHIAEEPEIHHLLRQAKVTMAALRQTELLAGEAVAVLEHQVQTAAHLLVIKEGLAAMEQHHQFLDHR